MGKNPNIRYVLTLDSTAQHDAERQAGLARFLKAMGRSYGLKCRSIQATEIPAKTPVKRRKRAKRASKSASTDTSTSACPQTLDYRRIFGQYPVAANP